MQIYTRSPRGSVPRIKGVTILASAKYLGCNFNYLTTPTIERIIYPNRPMGEGNRGRDKLPALNADAKRFLINQWQNEDLAGAFCSVRRCVALSCCIFFKLAEEQIATWKAVINRYVLVEVPHATKQGRLDTAGISLFTAETYALPGFYLIIFQVKPGQYLSASDQGKRKRPCYAMKNRNIRRVDIHYLCHRSESPGSLQCQECCPPPEAHGFLCPALPPAGRSLCLEPWRPR